MNRMTKVKKGKVIQMLSPENYIRKKARTLPILECLVSTEWEETRMPTVVIARNHTNGTITVCTYLVDLGCLGVKDSMFLFNVTMPKYSDLKEKISSGIEMTEVDYPLAHNIILAGVEYAAEFGFKPCKEYESVTKFMLEEDSEEIELIEIECGTDGKPLYVQGPFEDTTRARQIIAQLEKTAGPGNYHFILNVGNNSMDDDEDGDLDDEDDPDDEDEFDNMAFGDKKELFLSLFKKIDDLADVESKRFLYLLDSLVDDLVDVDKYDQFCDQLEKELDIEVEQNEIPNQLLGLKPGGQTVSKQLKDRFISIYQMITFNPELADKEIKLFQKEPNGIPGACFLELHMLQTKESPKYAKLLNKYAKIYPDYALIQLLWSSENVMLLNDQQKLTGDHFKLKTFFPERETIHPLERYYALMLYAFSIGLELDMSKMEAFTSIVYQLGLPENEELLLINAITVIKIGYLVIHFKE